MANSGGAVRNAQKTSMISVLFGGDIPFQRGSPHRASYGMEFLYAISRARPLCILVAVLTCLNRVPDPASKLGSARPDDALNFKNFCRSVEGAPHSLEEFAGLRPSSE
jgi:hypothetical protein